MSSAKYTYTPLRAEIHQIRLLKISTTAFQLQSYSLSKAPPYTALSYTWGPDEDDQTLPRPSPQKTRLVTTEGSVLIPDNLHRALLEVRARRSRLREDLFVWADACSINQNDVDEVTQQVNIMDQIYGQADMVLVWLGSDERQEMGVVNQFLDSFKKMHHSIAEASSREGISPRTLARRDMTYLLSSHDLPSVNDGQWRILLPFFRRTWFRRIWIIQEVALAKVIEVWCGSESLSWASIDHCATIMNSDLEKVILSSDSQRSDTSVIYHSRFAGNIARVREWCTTSKIPDEFTGVYELITGRHDFDTAHAYILLGFLSACSATDPRDKVFGVLGVFSKMSSQRSILANANYRLKVDEVYTDTTTKIIRDTNWLGLLSLKSTQGALRSQLPSWVPGFAPTSVECLDAARDVRFNASGRFRRAKTCQPSDILINGTRLGFLGHRAARVKSISESLQSFYDHKVSFEVGIDLVLQLHQGNNYVATGEPIIDVLWKTLICGNTLNLADDASRSAFLKYWLFNHLFLAVLSWNSHKIPTDVFVKTLPNMELFAQLDDTNETPGHAVVITAIEEMRKDAAWVETLFQESLPYSLVFGNWVGSRVLFSTDDGHLGICPEDVQEHDEVWITPNASVPFVIRPQRTSGEPNLYTLVGEAYVHGLMHGEFFDNREPTWQRVWLD